MPLKVFCSYTSKDERYKSELEKHLAPMRREKLIDLWTDRNIEAGQDWEREIHDQLKDASIILLLLSADFLASDYCTSVEAKAAIERHEKGEAVVIPIVLKHCDWTGTFGHLQALPGDKPLKQWSDRERAWTVVVDGIRNRVVSILNARESEPPVRLAAPDDIGPLIGRVIDTFPPPFVAGTIDEWQLRRVIRASKPLPPVFYRWRAQDALHWVEFAHFLLFRRLADVGFHLQFLIDDVDHELPSAIVRPPVERLTAAMFAHQAQCHWLRDQYPERAKYSAHAQQRGFDIFIAGKLARSTRPDFDPLAQFWLEFLTWLIREEGRCIIYATDRRLPAYSILRGVNMESAIITRPMYHLEGNRAKSGDRKMLVVEPPQYTAILSWLVNAAPADIRTLAMYLTLNASVESSPEDADVLARASALLAPNPEVLQRIWDAPRGGDFLRGSLALLDAMLEWNERYFKTWS